MLATKTRSPLLLSTLFTVLFAGACEDGTRVGDEVPLADAGAATVRVLLTDAPADYIGSAEVDIGAVELIPADDGAPIVLSDDGTDGFVNLLELQNAATVALAEADIEAGSYAQLRLIVEAARVELADGYAFRDGSTEEDLKVPSGAQTGIKLILRSTEDDGPLMIAPGETVLVLDFDVNQSYVLLGNPETPAGIHGVIFKPTLRVTVEDVAASISGTVSTELDDVSVEGLMVRAEPTDGGAVEGFQSETGTALTGEDGSYTIFFLVPGNYEVTVDLEDGLATDPPSRSIELGEGEAATGADFSVVDVSGSISGTVSTALEDTPVEDLTVTATPDSEGADPITTTTDAEGAYTFASLAAGSYTISVDAGEGLTTDPETVAVELAENGEETGVDFEIVEADDS